MIYSYRTPQGTAFQQLVIDIERILITKYDADNVDVHNFRLYGLLCRFNWVTYFHGFIEYDN